MTWYGESYALDWGSVISGTPFSFSLLNFHYDTQHHVMAAGESFTIGSYLDTAYSADFAAFSAPIEMRWVIETNASSGTLHLYGGADPSEAYTNTSLATQDLGSFVVTGPTTIVSPPITGVSKADLEAYSTYPFVWIQCTAGSVDVQQVKMRVWPAAGPSGDWSTTGATSFTGTGGATKIRAQQYQQNAGPSSESAAWAAAVAYIDAYDGSTLVSPDTLWGSGSEQPATTLGVSFDSGTGLGYVSQVSSTSVILTPYGNEASVYDTPTYSSTGYDPREIRYEARSQFRAIGGGPVLPTITALHATATGTDSAHIAMQAISAADRDLAVSTNTYRFAPPTGAVALTDGVSTSLTPPGTGPVIFSVYPDNYFADPGGSGSIRNSALTVLGMTCTTSYSGYEWFDPTLPFPADVVVTPPLPSVSSADTGDYVYEGDVGVGTGPAPILWFVYKKWGFLGNSFVVYGQNLGNTQTALHGVLKMGPGLDYPIVGDTEPPITTWTLNAASSHAYDGTGVIFPGTAIAPPVVDVEVQTIEFVVPTDTPLPDPTEFHLYVVNDNGTSNSVPLMLYPMVDINMESAEPLLMTTTTAMGVFTRPDEDVLEQRYSLVSAPFVLTGQVPERPPLFLTNGLPDFTLTGGVPSTGLDDPVDVALPIALRYRPLDSQVTPRPDLGTGMSVWDSNESSTMDLKFNVASAPFVDADNVISSRNGDLVRPAMVFPGDAWMETTNGFAAGPRFTIMMAVTIYADPQPRSYVMSSFVSGAPDPDSFPLNVYVEGDQVSVVIGSKQQVVRVAPGYIGQRPIIIGISVNDTTMRTAVVSDKATITQVTHPRLTASGLKLYLGRNNDAGNMQIATMDVLDLGIDNVTPAAPDRFWSIINRLDGIYGVMK